MNFNSKVIPYLEGKEFTNSLFIDMPATEQDVFFRDIKLIELSRAKNILHVGCVDHIPLIEKKIKAKTWLHSALTDSATKCLGIDINKEGIEYIQKLGYTNCITLDILKDEMPAELTQHRWDYVILGEILEHVDNPVLFLEKLREKMRPYCDKIIITVPNAFRHKNFIDALRHRECINTDHRFWFTPYTLAKVGVIAGFKVDSFFFAMSYRPGFFTKLFLKKFPVLRENLIMILSF